MEISFGNTLTHLREMLRGDLDGDGIEDMLVSAYIRADGGSFGAGTNPFALALRKPGERFSVTAIVPAQDIQ